MMSRKSEAEPPESETSRPHSTRRPTGQQKQASRQPHASLSTSPHNETGSKYPERVAVAGNWEIKENLDAGCTTCSNPADGCDRRPCLEGRRLTDATRFWPRG